MGIHAAFAAAAMLFLCAYSAPVSAQSDYEVSSGNQATTFRGAPPPDTSSNDNSGSNSNSGQDASANSTRTEPNDNTDKFGKEWLEQQLQGNEPRVVRPY